MQRRHRQQLVAPVAHQPHRPLVDEREPQRDGVEDEHPVIGGVQGSQHPMQLILGCDPLGDVPHRGHREHVIIEVQRAEADLDRELRAVRSPGPQLQTGTHGPHRRLGPETGAVRPMDRPKRLR
jgi:hypothetical protein